MRTWNAGAAALLASLQAGTVAVPFAQLLEFGFDPIERYTTAGGDLTWGGYTWTSLGVVLEPIVSTVAELPGITFALPGVPPSILALALNDPVDGITARVYDALIDPADGTVADALLSWSGTLSMPTIEEGPREAAVSLRGEHRGVLAMRVKPSRYTNDEQQRLHPGDTSLDVDPMTDGLQRVWPAASYWFQ